IGMWVLLAICCLVIIARLAVRAWKRLWTFWISDLFLVLALLTFMTLAVGDTYSFSKGYNSFAEYYDEGFTKWMFSSVLVFELGFYLPRFSLLAFYYQLFPVSEEKLRMCLHVATGYSVCAFLTVGLLYVFWCGVDVAQNWSSSESACKVTLIALPTYIVWPLGVISELLVFFLPFGMLRRLKSLRKREWNSLVLLFLLGAITILISVARFILNVQSIFSYDTCKNM
ncbi:hypothetical protein BKA56DRAFT_494317, partial [Ilyonectria sp. MPI-CAGE-AT-0026]